MVFYCRYFSFGDLIEDETRAGTNSASVDNFYTAGSNFDGQQSGSMLTSQSVPHMSPESRRRSAPSLAERPSTLRLFKHSDLKAATGNFDPSTKIGEGGFGSVHLGVIKSLEDPFNDIDVAVKLGKKGLQGHKQWLTEVNVLGEVEHPNLVKLVGYCAEDDESGNHRLLVYEYMPNRSLDNHLSAKSGAPLSWGMRLKVARDAATGLAYLHEGMDRRQIIFRDFKPSNILLDSQWNAKLSDLGFARLGPSEGKTHVLTMVVGTKGYAAPEYMQTGCLTAKSDVWSYGVFLYELITGRRPLDRNRPKSEQQLLEWVKSYLDSKKFWQIVDTRLEDKYSLRSAMQLSSIANKCLSRNPKSRPKMSEVLEMVNQVIGAPSEASRPGPAFKGLVQNAMEPENVFVGSTKEKKTTEDVQSKGKRRFIDIKLGDSHWFSRIWPSKLLKAR